MTDKKNVITHDEMVKKMLTNPAVKAEYDRLDEEFSLLDALLQARDNAGLAQAVERTGIKKSANDLIDRNVTFNENAHSFATFRSLQLSVRRCRFS